MTQREKRKHGIHKIPGYRLTDGERETPRTHGTPTSDDAAESRCGISPGSTASRARLATGIQPGCGFWGRFLVRLDHYNRCCVVESLNGETAYVCVCIRFTSGPDILRDFCCPILFTSHQPAPRSTSISRKFGTRAQLPNNVGQGSPQDENRAGRRNRICGPGRPGEKRPAGETGRRQCRLRHDIVERRHAVRRPNGNPVVEQRAGTPDLEVVDAQTGIVRDVVGRISIVAADHQRAARRRERLIAAPLKCPTVVECCVAILDNQAMALAATERKSVGIQLTLLRTVVKASPQRRRNKAERPRCVLRDESCSSSPARRTVQPYIRWCEIELTF